MIYVTRCNVNDTVLTSVTLKKCADENIVDGAPISVGQSLTVQEILPQNTMVKLTFAIDFVNVIEFDLLNHAAEIVWRIGEEKQTNSDGIFLYPGNTPAHDQSR